MWWSILDLKLLASNFGCMCNVVFRKEKLLLFVSCVLYLTHTNLWQYFIGTNFRGGKRGKRH